MSTGKLTDALRETLELFGDSGTPLTTTEAADRLDLGRRSTYDRLDRLVEHGEIETKKVGAGARVWWRPATTVPTEGTESADDDSSRQFDLLVDAAEEYAIFGLDPDGRVRSWNDGARRVTGYTEDEIVGRNVSTFYTEDDRTADNPEADLTAAASDGSIEDEGWRVRADGSTFWARVTVTALHDDDGRLRGFLTVTRDTTDRREREQRLRRKHSRSEERYRSLFESIDQGYCIVEVLFDSDGEPEDYRFVETNPAFEEQTGLHDAVGKKMRDLEPDHERHWFDVYGDVARTGESVRFEAEAEALAGEWYDVYAFQFGDPEGQNVAILFDDVTERKERERELELYETIVETIDDGVYVLDEEYCFTRVNDAYVEMTGYDRAELLGSHCTLVIDEDVSAESAERLEEIVAGEATGAAIEADVHRADGSRLRAESRFTDLRVEDDERPLKVGVVRDVSERVQRERELEESKRRYRTLVDNFPNGIVTLFDEDFRHVIAGGELYETFDWSPEETIGETLFEHDAPDEIEILEPLYRAALNGESNTEEVEYAGRTVQLWTEPVTDDAGDVFAGMAMSQDVTDRVERERQLERQRERLAVLNNLNGVVRDLSEAVIDQSTREEIESVVCRKLAATDSYEFAWIGGVDTQTRSIRLRTEAGVEGYLDDQTISVDPDDPRSSGPTGRAVRTHQMQVTEDVFEDDSYVQWREHAREHGFRSSAAIPIVHQGVLYGVLNVYADRSGAFSGAEGEVIDHLAEVIGHAISAIEQNRALTSDEVVELEFRIPNVVDAFDLPASTDGRLTLDRAVPGGDDDYLVYGTATDDMADVVDAFVDDRPHWESVRFIGDHPEGNVTSFELRLVDPPVLSAVTALGGYVERAVIEDGDFYAWFHLAPSVDAQPVVESVQEAYPAAQLTTKRQVSRTPDSPERISSVLAEHLTERQRAALEAGYFAGYFEWPRDSSGEEVADSLGISAATYHQHLRNAQQRLLRIALDARESV